MRSFLIDCVNSAAREQADRIRGAASLLPAGHRYHFACPRIMDLVSLEAMLKAEAFESAVFAMIGEEVACMLSRSPEGLCLATIVLSDGSEEMIAEGSTPALALLAAHISALLADVDREVGQPAFGERLN